MIRTEEMPYQAGIAYRDGEPIVYDSGDYAGDCKKRSTLSAASPAFRRRQLRRAGEGRYLGLGIGCYVEGTGVGPFERAIVRVDPSGKIYVSCGAAPQGQGMETIFSQVVADVWKVAPEDVVSDFRRYRGDPERLWHDREPQHRHRFGGDPCTRAGGCARRCSRSPPHLLECAPADLELRRSVAVVGVVSVCLARQVSLAKVAQAARPGWEITRPPGVDAGLEETRYWQPPTVTWSYAVHVAIVEVDPETGRVDDRRNTRSPMIAAIVVNPMLVEGQITGGTAQGPRRHPLRRHRLRRRTGSY